MKGQYDRFIALFSGYFPSVQLHGILRHDPLSGDCLNAVYQYPSRFEQAVSLPPRTDSVFGQIFIYSDSIHAAVISFRAINR